MKATTFHLAAAVLLVALGTHDAAAQWNAGSTEQGRNRIYVSMGLDPAIVASIGYARLVPALGRDFQVGANVGLAGGEFDVRDFRARLELASTIVRSQSVQLRGSAAFVTRGTDNSIYRGFGFGADITGTLGVYRQHWFAGAQFGKDKAIVTHITHSDYYRNTFFKDAKDGWYLDAGGAFHYGLTAGVSAGRAELSASAGFRQTEKFNDLTPPFYASVGLGLGF